VAVSAGRQFNAALTDWFELRGSLIAAEAVALAAAARTESAGLISATIFLTPIRLGTLAAARDEWRRQV